MKRNGPEITVKVSCFDCNYQTSESYTCQGDWGFDDYCIHPESPDFVAKGRTPTERYGRGTPHWCPFRKTLLELKLAEEINKSD